MVGDQGPPGSPDSQFITHCYCLHLCHRQLRDQNVLARNTHSLIPRPSVAEEA